MARSTHAAVTTPRDDAKIRFEIANRLFFRLYQASNLMHKTGSRSVSEFETTTQQWAVLGALSRPEARDSGMTVKELIEYLLVSRQNLTGVLDRLQALNFIERTRAAEDGRIRRVRLTRRGNETWARMLDNIGDYYGKALVDFTTEEALLLYRLLDRLKSRLQVISSETSAP